MAALLQSSLFISRPQQLKLTNLSSFRIRNSINNPVFNFNNNKNVSLFNSKFGNTNSKRSPIDDKPDGESSGGDNSPPPNGGGGGEDDYEEKKFILTPYQMVTRYFAMFRNRMLAVPSFLFKVGTQTVIDSCCATFAHFQKIIKGFWDQFLLYALVGIVVGMLAPYARIGNPSVPSGGFKKSLALPTCSSLNLEKPGGTCSTQKLHPTSLCEGSLWALGFLTTRCAMLLDKMLPDLQFLFEAGIEIIIDSCCATFAEIQKRGKYLWDEFKSYAADLLAGMLAPYARTGNRSIASGSNNSVATLPSSDERYQRLTIYICHVEQMSSCYNHTDPTATFSLGATSQRRAGDYGA